MVVCRNICICGVLVVEQAAGADPGILVRGGVWIFFIGMGSGDRPMGPGNALVGAQGAKPPEAPAF